MSCQRHAHFADRGSTICDRFVLDPQEKAAVRKWAHSFQSNTARQTKRTGEATERGEGSGTFLSWCSEGRGHTPSIAFRHLPPRKDVVNQCLEFGEGLVVSPDWHCTSCMPLWHQQQTRSAQRAGAAEQAKYSPRQNGLDWSSCQDWEVLRKCAPRSLLVQTLRRSTTTEPTTSEKDLSICA